MDDIWSTIIGHLAVSDLGRLSCVNQYHRIHTGQDWHWRRVVPPDWVRRGFPSAKQQTAATLYHSQRPVQDAGHYHRQRAEHVALFHKWMWWARQKQHMNGSLATLDLRRYLRRAEEAHRAIQGYDQALRRKRCFEC